MGRSEIPKAWTSLLDALLVSLTTSPPVLSRNNFSFSMIFAFFSFSVLILRKKIFFHSPKILFRFSSPQQKIFLPSPNISLIFLLLPKNFLLQVFSSFSFSFFSSPPQKYCFLLKRMSTFPSSFSFSLQKILFPSPDIFLLFLFCFSSPPKKHFSPPQKKHFPFSKYFPLFPFLFLFSSKYFPPFPSQIS